MKKNYTSKDVGRMLQMARILTGFKTKESYAKYKRMTRSAIHRRETGAAMLTAVDFLNCLAETGIDFSIFFRESIKSK